MRKIEVNGETYEWRVGKTHVIIRHAGKKFAAPDFAELLNRDWYGIERDQFKGGLHITPADVASYIRSYE